MRRALTLILLVAAIAGGLYWLVYLRPPIETAGGGRRGGAGPDGIPVVVAAAETRDVPIYLDGLGTVQASEIWRSSNAKLCTGVSIHCSTARLSRGARTGTPNGSLAVASALIATCR